MSRLQFRAVIYVDTEKYSGAEKKTSTPSSSEVPCMRLNNIFKGIKIFAKCRKWGENTEVLCVYKLGARVGGVSKKEYLCKGE